MAKKKATMTLKDFHGGSIPSDLPLPSAPGVTVRPLNHTGLDRHTSWSNPMGRQDHRLRPGSAGAVRTYDDKTPFLSHNVQIGRNFDENERKPLDGGSAPRRTISDENIRGGVPVHQEPIIDYPVTGNVPTRPATTPVSQFSGGNTGGSYATRFSEAANVSRSYVKSEGTVNGPGPSPNAWGPRKVAVGNLEPVAPSWSAPDAATKLAHASALEKVTSGRWLSNQHKQTDVEVNRHTEPETKAQIKGNSYYGSMEDASLACHAGRSLGLNDGGPELHPCATSEWTERPKLKLLPRSKPADNVEPVVAYKQSIRQSGETVMVEIGNERNPLFGGARPRELVLKERGVDDIAVKHDIIHSPNRMKKEISRAESQPIDHHHRMGKSNMDRRDADAQKRSNWKQERPPSPETWRKPPVDPTPVDDGARYGKAASAVELAQAFSKSVSDPKVGPTDRFSGQTQIPFSRLTTSTRPQINGH